MARGGKRPGAGRKPGSVTQRTRDIADAMMRDGKLTPLEYLLNIVRDAGADEAKRIDCAKAAAPYLHPKLSAIEGSLNVTASIEEVRHRVIDGSTD